MIFLNNLLYKLGTSFDENNIDLELHKEYSTSSFYNSNRYSEIYLFGKVFESICLLQFSRNKLITIQYKIEIKHLQYFKNSINIELPEDKQLKKDQFNPKPAIESYIDGVAISLVVLNEEFFLFKLSVYPSLPRIKTK
jgi:hypothetical protein